ncbi:AP180 N-terminal ANTH domain-containing protein [Cinnamomum micranthum f. kanehirae]|uniref:AP180 N-terminal ANTH domain-containing protein n=1 Tax=Cinnamomum micranthum f. kanehirae TaxID=337451 RepID=A0A3S4NW86_9MAGN|nr:AP180 N-terminal ANTH domain-containing protein [Cinnamomum micranthum f. kanehirae]
MPSRFQKVIATIKDQTSISLAKVSATKLEVAILMATTHKELPVGDALVEKVVLLTFAKRAHASICIHSLKGRMAHTSNWVVALKSLNLVFRILQEGDPHFDQQVLRAAKCGTKLLDLSNFCDKSHSSPWDYTAFIRTFALYLDERLHCTLMGKLHRATRPGHRHRDYPDHVHGAIKPTFLLDKITYWQRLLDRALATQPTGSAKCNRLLQLSLWSVVLETFDLYRDISNGIALLLDNFFHLQLQSCFEVIDVCNKAVEQFDELAAFYSLCKSLGVGRELEYPCIQKISERLLKTLRELLEDDEASFEIDKTVRSGSQFLALPAPPFKRSISSDEDFKSELNSEEELEQPSLLTEQSVLESALIALKEKAAKVHRSIYLDNKFSPDLLLLDSGNQQQQQQRQLPSSRFPLFHHDANSILDLVPLGDPSQHQETPLPSCSEEGRNESWERVLTECVEKMSNQVNCNKSSANNSLLQQSLYNHNSAYGQHQNYSNPFLQGDNDANPAQENKYNPAGHSRNLFM